MKMNDLDKAIGAVSEKYKNSWLKTLSALKEEAEIKQYGGFSELRLNKNNKLLFDFLSNHLLSIPISQNILRINNVFPIEFDSELFGSMMLVNTKLNEIYIHSQLKIYYDKKEDQLSMGNKLGKFTKDSKRAVLLRILLKSKTGIAREWTLEDIANKLGDRVDYIDKAYKTRFFVMCDDINKHIAKHLNINNFLKFNSNSVQISLKYKNIIVLKS